MVGRIFLVLNLSAFLIVANDSSRPLPVHKRSASVINQENAFARNVMRASDEFTLVIKNKGRARALSKSQDLTSAEAQEKKS